ncbi:MAG TPA: CHAD domain-containing protein, partial [Methylovirgula sp.]|nr:CHAD domain-containing protein [Methylovirgula sp.]
IFRIESQTNSWSEPRAEIRLERLRLIAGRKQASLAVATFTCPNGAADFFRFIAEICASAKLHLSAGSAALQAYRHFGALRAMHVSAFAPKLRSEMTVEDAFKTIARACLDQFLLNESAVRLGADCEAVHQCRVALRRLLASLRFFSGIVSGPELDALRPELKQVARYFQKPRDLDVLIGEVFPASPPKEFVEIIEERRGSAYEALGGALCSQETANFFTRFLAWIEAGDWTQDPARDLSRKEKIVAFVERKLTNATEKFKSRCAALDHADEEERHKIRIRAKNLRYSAEFFEGLVKSGKHRNARRFHAFVGALKDLQTILGRENDAHMGRRFLASLAQEMGQDRKAKKAPLIAIAALSGRIEGLSEPEYRRKIGKARRAFAEIKPFWDKIPLKKNLETAKKFEG